MIFSDIFKFIKKHNQRAACSKSEDPLGVADPLLKTSDLRNESCSDVTKSFYLHSAIHGALTFSII